MEDDYLVISFPEATTAEANKYTVSLRDGLKDVDPSIKAESCRDNPETQDFGATLAIILGTASATAVANGIAMWLKRNSGARIQISSRGSVIATNLDSQDAAKIAAAFAQK